MHGDDPFDGSPSAGEVSHRVDQLRGIVGIADDGEVAKCVRGPRVGKLLRDAQHDDVIELPRRPGRHAGSPLPGGG